jgi:hypothetical protein
MHALLRRLCCACVARGVHSNHLVWKLSTKVPLRVSAGIQESSLPEARTQSILRWSIA